MYNVFIASIYTINMNEYSCPLCEKTDSEPISDRFWVERAKGIRTYICNKCAHDINLDMKRVPKKYFTKSKLKRRKLPGRERNWNDRDIKENLGAPDILCINTGWYGYSKNNIQIYLLTRIEEAEKNLQTSGKFGTRKVDI